MKLKEYVESLQKIAKKHPDLEVIYGQDDEGNSFGTVNHTPSVGNYSGGWSGEWAGEGSEDFEENKLKVNAVCIN